MSKDEKQFQIGILEKLIGKELSETLEKEKIEAWIDGGTIIFQKTIPLCDRIHPAPFYHGPYAYVSLQFKQNILKTIELKRGDIGKEDFPLLVQNVVMIFNTKDIIQFQKL